nr:hypothetical protein [Stenotrophomonas ginsengisoli]
MRAQRAVEGSQGMLCVSLRQRQGTDDQQGFVLIVLQFKGTRSMLGSRCCGVSVQHCQGQYAKGLGVQWLLCFQRLERTDGLVRLTRKHCQTGKQNRQCRMLPMALHCFKHCRGGVIQPVQAHQRKSVIVVNGDRRIAGHTQGFQLAQCLCVFAATQRPLRDAVHHRWLGSRRMRNQQFDGLTGLPIQHQLLAQCEREVNVVGI